MRTVRVPMVTPGDYREVRVYGRYGSIAVTEHPMRRGYVLTHAPSGQRAADAVFVRLDTARACARDLAALNWTEIDRWAETIRPNPWSANAREPKPSRARATIGRRVRRIVERHRRAEDLRLASGKAVA